MDYTGYRVVHNGSFGEGTVIGQDDEFISVRFDNSPKTIRKFGVTDAIGKYLTIINDGTMNPEEQNNESGSRPAQTRSGRNQNGNKDTGSPEPGSPIAQKLESWQQKLLDLGKRNKLLNFRLNAKNALIITEPAAEDLYSFVVKEEKTVVFPLPSERRNRDDEAEDETEAETETSDVILLEEGNVSTNQRYRDQQRILRNLRNKAKTALEEQGINMLYLCFGFLKWTEIEYSSVEYDAPLIMVPVELTVDSIISPYELKMLDEEIVVNPTLAYKLSSEYGIILPDFDENGSVLEYLDEVNDLAEKRSWRVTEDVGLGITSFLKINMYNDLVQHADEIATNPLVKAFAGDSSELTQIPDGLAEYDFDKERPSEVFQVVDADSSQQEAILLANNGVSFVLQGPPGTGKSQTITNIIAESLARGKKVLFVSEKMAALEVVFRRLQESGLDDFCMVLHSHKTKKRDVLDQLQNTLNLGEQKVRMIDDANRRLDSLEKVRDALNEYAEEIYQKVPPLNRSIYDVNGYIAALENTPDVTFELPEVKDFSEDDLLRYERAISDFSRVSGDVAGSINDNPWRNAVVTTTYEFRHDANAKLQPLNESLRNACERMDSIYADLSLGMPLSVSGAKNAVRFLGYLKDAVQVPDTWVLTGNIPEDESIAELLEKQQNIEELIDDAIGYYDKLSGILEKREKNYLSDIASVRNEIISAETIIDKDPDYNRWTDISVADARRIISESISKAEEIHEIESRLLEKYERQVFDIDHDGILARLKSEYTSFFRVFKKSYKEDLKNIAVCHRQIGIKTSFTEMVDLIMNLKLRQELREWFAENSVRLCEITGLGNVDDKYDFKALLSKVGSFSSLAELIAVLNKLDEALSETAEMQPELIRTYSYLYKGNDTDWMEVYNAASWARTFRELYLSYEPDNAFIKKVCESSEAASYAFNSSRFISDILDSINADYEWFKSCFSEEEDFDEIYLPSVIDREAKCENFALLEEWNDYCTAKGVCKELGLSDFITVVEDLRLPSALLVSVFRKRFYRVWLDKVIQRYPAVLSFRRKKHEEDIREFTDLDRVQLNIARQKIRADLINKLPVFDRFSNAQDEVSILRRELNKQRRIMPIRKLFGQIPTLLLTLKPCLMMSPLSVSLFLESKEFKFDTVIFDEASQVYTESAIGAISRGKQVIIAGDRNQLPPTNFFQVNSSSDSVSEYDDDDEENYDFYDSVLDEASNLFPFKTLRWHYRSKHESLITFSNVEIYDRSLITFPSSIESMHDVGVEYVYVREGFYDRGGKNGNRPEAEKVAELVFHHIEEFPERSLGVIAFGETQQLAIENALRAKRQENQDKEWFFSEENESPFFVKSLENVQGDERDTIIFSIGYAKDANGVFRMQFGPLSVNGGERRLNVAVTRAKINVKLVGSILPTDIDTERISTKGPKLLRAYIDYAMRGEIALEGTVSASDELQFDSPFERAVYDYLTQRGFKVATQVGCSSFRIDLAVIHPELPGVFVLGIECDGASYHSARTARERDRLRQDVLEGMGWNIYRIWSTDWIKDTNSEGVRLINAVNKAIRDYGADNADQSDLNNNQIDFTVSEEKDTDPISVYGFVKRQEYSLPYNAWTFNLGKLPECIMTVVNEEYPIHFEMLCRRLENLLGNGRVTARVRVTVENALEGMRYRVKRKGDFIYPINYNSIPLKYPNSKERTIQYISQDELETAISKIARTFVGATRDTIISETARVYGFQRTGEAISDSMNTAVDSLIRKGELEESDGKISSKENDTSAVKNETGTVRGEDQSAVDDLTDHFIRKDDIKGNATGKANKKDSRKNTSDNDLIDDMFKFFKED